MDRGTKCIGLSFVSMVSLCVRFPQRYVVILLSVFGMLICCGQRDNGNIGVAVVLKQIQENISNYTDVDIKKAESQVDLTDVMLHMIIMGLPVGHFLALIPTGIFTDVLSARWVFFWGVLIASGITVITPTAVQRGGYLSLFFLRICLGICQAVIFPCTSALLTYWIPINERSVAGGIMFSAYPVSIIFAHVISDLVRPSTTGWHNCYYFWSGMGTLWCVLIALLVYSVPERHPRITEEEKEYLKDKVPKRSVRPIPMKKILGSDSIWTIIFGQMGTKMTIHIMTWDTPWQLKHVLDLTFKQVNIMITLSAFGLWATTIASGAIIQYGIAKKNWSLRWTRRVAATTFIIPNICMCIQVYLRNAYVSVPLYVIAVISLGLHFSSFRLNYLDISVHFPGVLLGMTDTFGDFVGFICYVVMKNITSLTFESYWQINSWLAFTITCFSSTYYFCRVQVNRAVWDVPPDEMEQFQEELNRRAEEESKRRATKAK